MIFWIVFLGFCPKWLPKNVIGEDMLFTFSNLFRRVCFGRLLGSFWHPFGSMLVALGSLLFWHPAASISIAFGLPFWFKLFSGTRPSHHTFLFRPRGGRCLWQLRFSDLIKTSDNRKKLMALGIFVRIYTPRRYVVRPQAHACPCVAKPLIL